MSALNLLLLASVVGYASAGSFCKYEWAGLWMTDYCAYGCCFTYADDPCCSIYVYPGFIAGMVIGSILLVVAAVAGLIYRRRRMVATTVTYAQPGGQQVFSTSTSTTQAGYANPGSYGYGYPGVTSTQTANTTVRAY